MAKRKSGGRSPQAQHGSKSKPSQHDKRTRLSKRNDDRRRTTEATVPLTGGVATLAVAMSRLLDARTRFRFPIVAAGALLAGGRRTAASWFRCAGVKDDWDRFYVLLQSIGKDATSLMLPLLMFIFKKFDPRETHIEFAFVYGGWKDSEKKLVEQLWKHIPEDAILYEDRGFFSYKHWESLHKKHNLLVRIQKSMVFKPIETYEDGSFLAKVYPSNWYRENDKQGILVRVIEYKLDDPQRTGHDEVHRLMTNLLVAEEFPAMELIMEYHERWEEELVFDEQKTHQDPCRAEKTTNLRSETTDGLKQELYAMSLGHFVTRALMLEVATEANIDVDRLSFKGSFQIIKTRLPECDPSNEARFSQWYAALVWEISRERIPPRRNRINPRVIKRKMSRWNKCRPQHRRQKPLTKTFDQTVVMLR